MVAAPQQRQQKEQQASDPCLHTSCAARPLGVLNQSMKRRSRRPTVGDKVRILVENEFGKFNAPIRNGTVGQVGWVTADDGSAQPYCIDLGDGRERWYRESWVSLLEDIVVNENYREAINAPESYRDSHENVEPCADNASENKSSCCGEDLQHWELVSDPSVAAVDCAAISCDDSPRGRKRRVLRQRKHIQGSKNEPDIYENADSSADEWMVTEIVW